MLPCSVSVGSFALQKKLLDVAEKAIPARFSAEIRVSNETSVSL
jgi:hypothetical protein